MTKQTPKLNPEWIRQTRDYFKEFLKVTKFPHPVRNGNRGSEFEYPEWMIMFIAILAVKAKVKTYKGIYRLALQYWQSIAQGTQKQDDPISATQLRDRLKKISYQPRRTPAFVFQIFPRDYFD